MSDENTTPEWEWPEDLAKGYGSPEEMGVEVGTVAHGRYTIGDRVELCEDYTDPANGLEMFWEDGGGTVRGFMPAVSGGDRRPRPEMVFVQWDDMGPCGIPEAYLGKRRS